MIPFLKQILWDESAFERYSRAILIVLGGMASTGQLPEWFPPSVGPFLMGAGALIGAGEKNQEGQ